MFHFNKKHIEDPAIPIWVLKARGKTYYVEHVDCSVPWSTKETPQNSHTKGSIKINNCLVTIDAENSAKITQLTPHDKIRLRNQERGITRVILSRWITDFKEKLKSLNIRHGPIKRIGGACSTTFYVCDIFDKEAVMLLQLALKNSDMRVLMPNEGYYRAYDTVEGSHIDVDYSHPDTPYEYS